MLGQGFGQAVLRHRRQRGLRSTVNCSLLPAPHTDFIYAVIVNELGLAGAAGLLCVYLLVVQRGFKIAMLARDSFSKLLATGLTSVFALQVFVIVGGVTKLIPLTGVTLPFVSYGGSSVLANFVLLALLLLSPTAPGARRMRVNKPISRLFLVALLMFAALLVVDLVVDGPAGRRAQPRHRTTAASCIRGAEDPPRARSARPTARRSRARSRDDEGVYHRTYPQRQAASAIRSATPTSRIGQTELERYRNEELTGKTDAITTTVRPALGQDARGRRRAHHPRPPGPAARRARDRGARPGAARRSRSTRARARSR